MEYPKIQIVEALKDPNELKLDPQDVVPVTSGSLAHPAAFQWRGGGVLKDKAAFLGWENELKLSKQKFVIGTDSAGAVCLLKVKV
jgi:hypothetical protein